VQAFKSAKRRDYPPSQVYLTGSARMCMIAAV
jgi:hypothetical protein